jgi:hypothetical protein
MILHTLIPAELIFQEGQFPQTRDKFVVYNGIPLIVEVMNETDLQVKQILSTNPNHYLQTDIYPGARISYWQ